MASGTRQAARLRESHDHEEGSDVPATATARNTRVAGESERSLSERHASEPPLPQHDEVNSNGGDIPSDDDIPEEEEFEHIANMTQEELDRRIQRAETQVRRRRQERQLYNLRREMRGTFTESTRLASGSTALAERPRKR